MKWADEFETRLVTFSSEVCLYLQSLGRAGIKNPLIDQLFRSSTSIALNYGEARGAESTKDFIHKLKISLKELNETRIGLKILSHLKPADQEKIRPLITESGELVGVISASIKTARRRL